MKHTLIYYFLSLVLFKEAVGTCDIYQQILNGTTNFVTQLWMNLTNSNCQKRLCKDNGIPEKEITSEESVESTEEEPNQIFVVECITRVKAPTVFAAKKSWSAYLSQWQYDYCMIASI